MKKNVILLLILFCFCCGCNKSNEENLENWDTGTFGEIDLNAPVVNTNDYEMEYGLNKYIAFTKPNDSDIKDFSINDYRLFSNSICEQLDVDIINNSKIEMHKDDESYNIYKFVSSNYGVYFYVDENEVLEKIKVEVLVGYSPIEENLPNAEALNRELFKENMARLLLPIYAGIPNLKNYDMDRLFNEFCEVLKDDECSYTNSFNGVDISIYRYYNWCTVTMTGYNQD